MRIAQVAPLFVRIHLVHLDINSLTANRWIRAWLSTRVPRLRSCRHDRGARAGSANAGGLVAVQLPLASLISSRCPSGSRKKQRTSQSDSTGGVSNSAPRERRTAYAAWQSGTRKVISWLTV